MAYPNDANNPQNSSNPDSLSMAREVQSLRMEVEEKQRQVETLRLERDRLQEEQKMLVETGVQTRQENLFRDCSAPVVQLLAQSYLLEVQQKNVQSRDVMQVASRLIRELQKSGLAIIGSCGEASPYDPNLHMPLNSGAAIQPGSAIKIRIPGTSYQGKVLIKAVVEENHEL